MNAIVREHKQAGWFVNIEKKKIGKKLDRIKTPKDAAMLLADSAGFLQEVFSVISLDSKNGCIACETVSLGLTDACLVHPREVFWKAVQHLASAIVLVHNHPSGDPSPSAEDVRITKQLIEAGEILGIKVMDHVIVAMDEEGVVKHLSLREEGLVQFV